MSKSIHFYIPAEMETWEWTHLLALLQHPDLLPLPAELGALLGEEGGGAATRLAHHPPDLAPLALEKMGCLQETRILFKIRSSQASD
jgi:hypothetical protein